MSTRNMLNGAQVIVDYLIQQKVPNVFGLMRSRQYSIHRRAVRALARYQDHLACITKASPASWPTSFTACPGSRSRPSRRAGRARPICRSRSATLFSNSVPFMAVTGNVPTSQFNRGAFQELYRHYQADFPSTVRSYCKKVFQPTRGEMVPLAVRQAWKTMVTGRPGPVVLDVPFDVFWNPPPKKRRSRRNGAPTSRAAAAPIRKAWSRRSTCYSAPSGR